jgi:hypothetical protein
MNQSYYLRMALAVTVALVAWMATVALLWLLPPGCSIAASFVGLALFLVGAKAGFRWPAAIGGLLMFSGAFVAALRGALG